MSRKRAAPPPPPAGERPLAGLAGLRRQLAGQPAPPPKTKSEPEDRTTEPAEDEAALFRAAVGDARPLPASGRAELDVAKPKPLPRPKAPEPAAEADVPTPQSRRLATEDELLREAMAGVSPLRDCGRVELEGPRAKPRPDPGQPADGLPDFPAELPSDIDPDDPAQLFRYAVTGAQPLAGGDRLHLERPPPHPCPASGPRTKRRCSRKPSTPP